jgi:uncharacterized membrane protein YagU involved in acid resistance
MNNLTEKDQKFIRRYSSRSVRFFSLVMAIFAIVNALAYVVVVALFPCLKIGDTILFVGLMFVGTLYFVFINRVSRLLCKIRESESRPTDNQARQ